MEHQLFGSGKRKAWMYIGSLFLFGVLVFWKVILIDEYSLLTYQDAASQTYPWTQYIAQMLHQGSFPFWDIYSDAGRSFGGEMQTGIFYPFNLVLGLIPLNSRGLIPISVVEGFIILHCIISSGLMYLLARQFGLNHFSSFISGLIFAYSGSIGWRSFGQPNLLYSSIWIPAVLLFFIKSLQPAGMFRRIFYANIAGLFLGLCILAGHHQPFLYVCLAVSILSLVLWFSRSLREQLVGGICSFQGSARKWIIALTGLVFFFALAYSSPQFFISLEYASEAYRWTTDSTPVIATETIPYSISGKAHALPPEGILAMIFPYIIALETSPYVGILALFFIMFSIAEIRKSHVVRWIWLLALLFLGLSLGEYFLLHGLFYAVIPGFDKGREALRLLLLAHTAMSLLAGFGCQTFFKATSKDFKAFKIRLVKFYCNFSLFVTTIVFVGYFYRTQVLNQPTDFGFQSFTCFLLLATSLLGILRFYSGSRIVVSLKIAAVMLLLLDYYVFLSPHFKLKTDFDRVQNFEPWQYYRQDDVLKFLQSKEETFRVDFQDMNYPRNIGQVAKLETINSYGATRLSRLVDFFNGAVGSLELLNVRYIVSSKELNLPKIFEGQKSTVYQNPSVLPRVWCVSKVSSEINIDQVFRRMRETSFDPLKEAVIEDGMPFRPLSLIEATKDGYLTESNASDHLLLEQYTPNRFLVSRKGKHPVLLVVSQNWYPGWTVIVNGTSRPISRVYGTLMGVTLDSGTSQVEFNYWPTHFYWSLISSGLAGVILIVAALLIYRRKTIKNKETLCA